MRILITRPIEDGKKTARRLRSMGHQILLAPLLTTHFFEGPPIGLEGMHAILATSANAIRALALRTPRRDLSVFAVGTKTAQQARRAGFSNIRNADGDAKSLAEAIVHWAKPEQGPLLHVCGQEAAHFLVTSLTAKGYCVRHSTLYEVRAESQMPLQVKEALKQNRLDMALFFSPRSAQVFRNLVEDLPTQRLIAICISKATAQALAPLVFAQVRWADAPNQRAMLALIS